MTRKQPKRRPIPVTARRPVRTALSPAQQAVVDVTRQLPQLADPVDVELAVSSAIASAPLDEDPWAGVIAHVAAIPSRRSLALLRALEVLLPDDDRAASAAAQFSDIEEPTWRELIGRLEIGECWAADRVTGAGYLTLLCSYRYGDQQHAVMYLIDEMLGGAAKNALVTREVAQARALLNERVGTTVIDAAEAHLRLAQAYGKLDAGPGLGIDPDVYATRLLTQRRIALAT